MRSARSRFYISRCTPMSPSPAEVCSRVIRSTSSADPTRRTTPLPPMTTSADDARGKRALWPAGNHHDDVTLRHQNRTVDGVFEFADVALPPGGGQRAPCICRDRPQRHAVGFGVFLGEMLGEFEDIRRAFAKRRYLQVDHVQPKQQVLTEAAFANGVREVAV